MRACVHVVSGRYEWDHINARIRRTIPRHFCIYHLVSGIFS